jgi:hypothetical protein
MLRLLDDEADLAGLGDRPAVEDDDVLADLVRRRQVVRDVDQRDAEAAVQLAQALQDRRAQRCVDHRDRLVGDDQLRLQQQARATMTRWRWPPESWWG